MKKNARKLYAIQTETVKTNDSKSSKWHKSSRRNIVILRQENRTYYFLFLRSDSDPLNMYFSCSVDMKSSKFQISRTCGKVLCRIPKREDGTVGELVIRNPGPVPFHALPLWDAKLNDLRYAPCKQYGEQVPSSPRLIPLF